VQRDKSGGIKLLFGGGTVQTGELCADFAELLAEFRPERLELRLERVRNQIFHILGKLHLLHVELILDHLNVIFGQRLAGLDDHLGKRLAVFQVGAVSCCAAEGDDFEHGFHVGFKRLVDAGFVNLREVAEMDAFGCRQIDGADQIAVNILRHERNHRRCGFGGGDKRAVKHQIRVDLVGLHPFCPVAGTAAADIPVAQLIHKILQRAGGLRNAVIGKVAVHVADHRVQAGKQPFVHHGEKAFVELVFGGVKAINVGVKHEKRIGVPQRAHEFALPFHNGLAMKAVRQPRRGVGIKIPADCVGAVGLQRFHRIDGVALGFAHFLAVFVLHMTEDDDVLIRRLVEQQRRDRQ